VSARVVAAIIGGLWALARWLTTAHVTAQLGGIQVTMNALAAVMVTAVALMVAAVAVAVMTMRRAAA
jgi:hypothetical protein